MKNAGLNEAQVGIKVARGNINNLRYTYYTILMAESEEELKSLLMKVKEESATALCSLLWGAGQLTGATVPVIMMVPQGTSNCQDLLSP